MTSSPSVTTVHLDDAHRYWLDGRELDGCTHTLKGVGLIDPSLYTEEARQRGRYVHAMIVMDLERDLAEESVEPVLFGYLLAARAFLRDADLEILAYEQSLADPIRGIAGTPDLFVQRRHRHVLVDWKTGGHERWHGFQLAWYEHLARVNGLIPALVERLAVYLHEDGTYTTYPFTDRIDWPVCQAAITVQQAKRLR